MALCKTEGCDRPGKKTGLCLACYQRGWRARGPRETSRKRAAGRTPSSHATRAELDQLDPWDESPEAFARLVAGDTVDLLEVAEREVWRRAAAIRARWTSEEVEASIARALRAPSERGPRPRRQAV